jgi:hypothetical protein
MLVFANLQPADAGNYTVVVTDAAPTSVTSSPPAVLTVTPSTPTVISGQWDFNQGNLSASYGQALQYFDATVQSETSFGATTTLTIPDIAGQPANVMYWAPATAWGGYVMNHGIAPNGGGTNVNQYTLIMDVLWPFLGWVGLWQTDVENGTNVYNDGDAFVSPSGGLGTASVYHGTLTAGEWHRIVLAFDEVAGELSKYVDGTNVVTSSAGLHLAQIVGAVDGRWSIGPAALLLADNDAEVMPVYVSSVQIRDGRMTDADVAAMGAPTAGKIPGLIKASKSGGGVVIDWTGSVLRSAPSVNGPWTVVPGALHPHTIASPTGAVFFKAATQ